MQPHYNLYERAGYEKELEGLCRSKNLAVIPYFPLAAGFLTGKYRSVNDLSKSVRGAGLRRVSQRTGVSHTRRARYGGGAAERVAGGRGARVAPRPAGDHGADCERHERSPVGRYCTRSGGDTGQAVDRNAGQRKPLRAPVNALQIQRIAKLPGDGAPLVPSDVPSPRPGERDVLIGVSVCGVCHTDLDEIEGRAPSSPAPGRAGASGDRSDP